jgi:ABC-type branched-subunit amino acid transport system substrate-binding protein
MVARKSGLVGLLGVAAMVTAAACGSSSSGNGAAKPAATASPITVGIVTSQTGPASADFYGNAQGAEARIDEQNAEGGVDGHQIKAVIGDDGSSNQGGQTAVSDLIQQQKVFGMIFVSDFVSSAYRIAQQQGVPVVGWAVDGPEWGIKPDTNMVAVEGNVAAVPPPNTLTAKVAKMEGAKNMASLAIGGEEPSILGAKAFDTAAASIGLKVGYSNYSIPVGTVDVGPVVLAMKQAHVDGFNSEMLDTTDFAIISGARQDGLKLVAPISVTGYGQDLLTQPTALQAAQGAIFGVEQTPVSEHTTATVAEQAAFAKYEHFSGVPSLSWTAGWTSADLFIQGLKAAGSDPTRTSFLSALHNLKGWTAGGLLPWTPDFSLATFGQSAKTQCSYYVKLTGSKFVPLAGGKPICGTEVGS